MEPRLDPVVVCSVLEEDVERSARAMDAAPRGAALVELRADRLSAEDCASLVRRAPRAVIVTARTPKDGGRFEGSEGERRRILEGALCAGARFVDVEWEGSLADLASGPEAGRVILSHHGAPCEIARLRELYELYRAMASTPAARLKLVPAAATAGEALAVRDLLAMAASGGRPLASFALGSAGAFTRILAPSWGSWATYGAAERGRETGAGQLPVEDLLDLHDVLAIGAGTRLFALAGSGVAGSPSPAMHTAGYRALGIEARYLPLEAESLDEIDPLLGAGGIGIEALAVTIPLKERAAARASPKDECARVSGAVNTVLLGEDRWRGYNTDGPAALALVRRHVDPAGARIAIAGAGGTARAIGAALAGAGAWVTFYNRDLARAEDAARPVGAGGGCAEPFHALADAAWDVLVQATPLGREGEEVVPAISLRGRLVLDVVYRATPTPLVAAARGRGVPAVDGFELLVEQAVLQFERMTAGRPDRRTMESAGWAWLQKNRSAT